MSKKPTLKFMHYYSRFLIKNFSNIESKYDLYSKTKTSSNISEDYVCSLVAQTDSQKQMFYKIEEAEDKITKFDKKKNGKPIPIESVIANALKIDKIKKEDVVDHISKELSVDMMIAYIKQLALKAPNFRSSRTLVKDLFSSTKQEVVLNSGIEAMNVWMRGLLDEKIRDAAIKKEIDKLADKNLSIFVLQNPYPLPLIDPGYNFFHFPDLKNHGFILQISEYFFVTIQGEEVSNRLLNLYGDFHKEQKYGDAINLTLKLIMFENPRLRFIYYTSKAGENTIKLKKIEELFESIQIRKPADKMLITMPQKKWAIKIKVNDEEKSIELHADEQDRVLNKVVYNPEFKHIFEGVDTSKLNGLNMQSIENFDIVIVNKKAYIKEKQK